MGCFFLFLFVCGVAAAQGGSMWCKFRVASFDKHTQARKIIITICIVSSVNHNENYPLAFLVVLWLLGVDSVRCRPFWPAFQISATDTCRLAYTRWWHFSQRACHGKLNCGRFLFVTCLLWSHIWCDLIPPLPPFSLSLLFSLCYECVYKIPHALPHIINFCLLLHFVPLLQFW